MDNEILEFLKKVSSKIHEIEDLVEDYGYDDSFLSCIVVGVVSENEEHGALLNSIYSMRIDSDEELNRLEEFIREIYSKNKRGGIDSLFKDINLN